MLMLVVAALGGFEQVELVRTEVVRTEQMVPILVPTAPRGDHRIFRAWIETA